MIFPTPFEIFDHTADIGMKAYGETLEELFLNAGRGFTSIVADLNSVEIQLSRSCSFKVRDFPQTLHQFLSQLIYWLDVEALLFSDFTFQLTPQSLHFIAYGEPFQADKHSFKTAIKAVTHHQLEIQNKGGIYEAKVIFDL